MESGGSDADVGDALAGHVSALSWRALGLPTRLSRGGRARGGDPRAGRGRDGGRLHAVNPREPTRGGFRASCTGGALVRRAGSQARVRPRPAPRAPAPVSPSPPQAPSASLSPCTSGCHLSSLLRAVRLHQHRLAHRVDPVQLGWGAG